MTPKEISRLARRIFSSAVPPNWAIRSQEDQEDYGIDYEIELTSSGDQATGFIFKVQQKGTHTPNYLQDGGVLSLSGVAVSKLQYYLHRVNIPVVLVAVDVVMQRAYWTVLQGNRQVEDTCREAMASGAKTVSIHIPTSNRLADTAQEVLTAVAECADVLLVRGVASADSERVVKAASRLGDFGDVAAAIGEQHDLFRCEQIDRLLDEGKAEDALRRSWDYLISPSESSAMRITCGLDFIRIYSGLLATENDIFDSDAYLAKRWDVAVRMLAIMREPGNRTDLRRYVRCFLRGTALRIKGERDFGLFMSSKVQVVSGNDFTRMITRSSRQMAAASTAKELRRAQLAVIRLIEGEHFHMLPRAWTEIVADARPFVIRLRDDGLQDAANEIIAWLERIGKSCLEACTSLKVWRDVILCALEWATLADPRDKQSWDDHFAEAHRFISAVEDTAEREDALAALGKRAAAFDVAARSPSEEEEIAMYRQMAHSMGVDPDDPQNDIDRIVQIGLRDLNPERVLRNCRHLFVSLGYSGIPAQMLGLPTAGSKCLHCTKHGHTEMALTLDHLWEGFSDHHCKSCPDRAPHATDWNWTKSWQAEQDRQWHAFTERRP